MTPEEINALDALVKAATPAARWDRAWDTQPYARDGYPMATYAIGPQHGTPKGGGSDEDREAYDRAASARTADVALIHALVTAAPALFAAAREVAQLRAERDELAATLANERGEGEPPEPGWAWEEGPSGQHFGVGQWVCVRSTTGVPNAIVRQNTGCAGASARWAWHVHVPNAGGYEKTARAAMRAATLKEAP